MINYFSQVIRSQRVKKSLTLINITGLSVCIATALLIILYVWSELSYDSFHNTERVYRVESRLYEGKTLTDNWATTTNVPITTTPATIPQKAGNISISVPKLCPAQR